VQKPQSGAPGKVEEINIVSSKPAPAMVKSNEGQTARGGQVMPGAKLVEDGPAGRHRVGSGNVDQGYSFEEPTTRGEAHEEQKQRRREGSFGKPAHLRHRLHHQAPASGRLSERK